MDSLHTGISYRSFLFLPNSLAYSISSAVEPRPSAASTTITLERFSNASTISSVSTSLLISTIMLCWCINVVGTSKAIVVTSIPSITVFTSGPWCEGTFGGLGTIELIGPFLTSDGSDPLLTITALTFLMSAIGSIVDNVRVRPVVLQDTTLV